MQVISFREPTLYRAKFILPLKEPLIEDGGIILAQGEVIRVGRWRKLKKVFSGRRYDLGEVIVLPALVNVHTHLELSALKWRLIPSGSFVNWVRSLIRQRSEVSVEQTQKAAYKALQDMWKEGIGLVGEVGNTGITIGILHDGPMQAVFFREIIDFKGTSSLKDFLQHQHSSTKLLFSLAPHAPYTVSPLLLQAIKIWTKRYHLPFSIHVAESPEEVVFLQEGKGPLRLLLEERKQWNPRFRVPRLSPIGYLKHLGVLDRDTICVHTVHVSQNDLETLAEAQARPCLCPRSNTYLGVGLPPLDKMLDLGLKPCIGTDSLASNDKLSIFAEMETLHRFFPQIAPQILVKMATLWGAEALKRPQMGHLVPKAKAEILAVPVAAPKVDPYEQLVCMAPKNVIRIYG